MHWWHWRAQLFFSVSISSPCLSPQTDSHCLLMPISFLCPRPNSSAPEIRCPWLLALACVMLYWEAITRYDRAKSVLQESVSGCNNLEQTKKNSTGKKNAQQNIICQCSGWWKAGSSDDNPVSSVVFGTQILVCSVFWEPLSKMRKEFSI